MLIITLKSNIFWLLGSFQVKTSLKERGSQSMEEWSVQKRGFKLIGDYNLQVREVKNEYCPQKCVNHRVM